MFTFPLCFQIINSDALSHPHRCNLLVVSKHTGLKYNSPNAGDLSDQWEKAFMCWRVLKCASPEAFICKHTCTQQALNALSQMFVLTRKHRGKYKGLDQFLVGCTYSCPQYTPKAWHFHTNNPCFIANEMQKNPKACIICQFCIPPIAHSSTLHLSSLLVHTRRHAHTEIFVRHVRESKEKVSDVVSIIQRWGFRRWPSLWELPCISPVGSASQPWSPTQQMETRCQSKHNPANRALLLPALLRNSTQKLPEGGRSMSVNSNQHRQDSTQMLFI